MKLRLLVAALASAGVCVAAPARAGFDFAEASASATPLTIVSDGVTAAFSSPSDPGAYIVNTSIFGTLGSTILQSPGLGPAVLDISFSAPVSFIGFAFATADFGAPTGLTATFRDGLSVVGTTTAFGVVNAYSGFPEGVIGFAGPVTAIELSDPDAFGLAISGLAVPEPSGLAAVAIASISLALRRRGTRA